MATTNHRKERPGRTLLVLLVVAVALFGAVGAGTIWSKATWAPKLALDLEGGTQITLTPTTTDGSDVTPDTIDEAIDVIRQRIDGAGVSEAQITSLGGDSIVVAIPGNPDQETIDSVSKAAQMRIRPVLAVGAPTPTVEPTTAPTDAPTGGATTAPTPTPTATAANSAYDAAPSGATAGNAAYVQAATPTPEPTPAATPAPAADADGLSSLSQITPAIQQKFDDLDCTDTANLAGGGGDDPKAPLVTCDATGAAKYILGPVEIEGTEIKSATSGLETTSQGVTTNNWVVNITFTGEGASKQTAMTKRLAGLDAQGQAPRNQFGMVLDGLVISAPSVDQQYAGTGITGDKSQISGNFTRQSAATLANQLNFGALPLTFEVQSQEQISATLGSEQLERGLLAGLIGLILVVIYSFFQYRVLGLLTVASLVVAAILTFGAITLLSWTQGYRLSLPGVAGLIVAIGFTADSFIVYFERIRDELRDGRSLQAAVDRGWARARRTVLAAKAVNLISAIVLYYLAVGGVQGFAFTLGLTVIVDVIVVFWFTHPVMALIAKMPYFRDGHRFSGLSPEQLTAQGVRYKGAGRFERETPVVTAADVAGDIAAETGDDVAASASDDDLVLASSTQRPASPAASGASPAGPATTADGRRMTIAERRAAQRAAQEHDATTAERDENEEQR